MAHLTEAQQRATELRQQRDEARLRLDGIKVELSRLGSKDGLTAGEAQRLERQLTAHDHAEAEVKRLDAEYRAAFKADVEEGLATGRYRTEPGSEPGARDDAQPTRRPGDLRGQALRAVDRLTAAPDHARHRLASALDEAATRDDTTELDMLARWTLATSSPAYARAVARLFTDPANGHREFDAQELEAFRAARAVQRAMSLGSDAAGAFLLPTHLEPSLIISNAGSVDPMRQVSRVVTVATESWHGVSTAGVSASWDGEAAQVSDDSPTLADASVKTHKWQAFVAASIETASDTTIGQQVGELFMDAKAQLEAAAFTTGPGDGSNAPTGVITAIAAVPGSLVTPTTGETYGRLDPAKVQESLPARWRANALFMANLSVVNLTRGFARLASGTEVSLVDESPEGPRVLGWRLLENSAMDGSYDASATANNYLLLAGDFARGYCVVDRVGTTVEYVPHLFGANGRPTGSRGWYCYGRTGGNVLVADAFRLLNVATTA